MFYLVWCYKPLYYLNNIVEAKKEREKHISSILSLSWCVRVGCGGDRVSVAISVCVEVARPERHSKARGKHGTRHCPVTES